MAHRERWPVFARRSFQDTIRQWSGGERASGGGKLRGGGGRGHSFILEWRKEGRWRKVSGRATESDEAQSDERCANVGRNPGAP
eukprot:scaffold23738_cov107-Isochrysis_galbana.AAC.2